MTEQEREIISNNEQIKIQRSGNSDTLRIPAAWRKSLPQLKGTNIIFEAHVERDTTGRIFIVFQKERPNLEVKKK